MVNSTSETSCSSGIGFEEIISKDKVRYVRKGYGIIFAVLFATSFFVLGPYTMKFIWKWLDDYSVGQRYMITLIPNHYVSYLFANAMMISIYWMKSPFFERYKIQNKPWPWEKDPQKFFLKCKQVVRNWIINAILGSLMCVIDAYVGPEVRTDKETLPDSFEVIWQISFCMIVEDFIFYWCHRGLHHPKVYPYIHKKHHEFYDSVSFAAEYAHPLEYVFGNVTPMFVGMKILGNKMHLATVNLWLFLRIMETIDGHSGYEFSFSPYRLLPFSSSSEYHNFHHSMNIGNYSSFFYIWDTVFKTNNEFFKYKTEKDKEIKLQKLRIQFEKTKKIKVN